MVMVDVREMLTSKEAAARLGITPETLSIWRGTGKSPTFHRVQRRVFYHPDDIKEFLSGRVTKASPPALVESVRVEGAN